MKKTFIIVAFWYTILLVQKFKGVIFLPNKVKINISGSEYTVNTEESEEYILSLGDELNRRIAKLMEDNPYLSPTMVASVAALQYCDEAKKRRMEAEDTKIQAKSAIESEAKIRLQLEEALREIERITRENRHLRTKMEKR